MSDFHHRPIKKFTLEGIIIDDSAIGRLKREYIRLLGIEMKLSGYADRLDIDPDFTIQYNHNKNYFEFKLTMYAIYVGKKKAPWIAGIDGTKTVYTHKNKSSVFSQEQV
jgi:hypothetical protein